MSSSPPRWVHLARILKPRGNKGEVAAEILTDFPERLATLPEVFLGDAESAQRSSKLPERIALKNFWLSQNHRGQGVFHFAGVNSINEAERFRGLDVLLPFDQRVALPAGQFFVSDLIGCSVFESSTDASPAPSSQPATSATQPIGVVSDVQIPGESQPGTPLLVLDTPRGETLIPLADDICTLIDLDARRIEVTLPEGLLAVNESE